MSLILKGGDKEELTPKVPFKSWADLTNVKNDKNQNHIHAGCI